MNMVIDAGNTRTKVGIFEGASMQRREVFGTVPEASAFIGNFNPDHLILSSVTEVGNDLGSSVRVTGQRIQMTAKVALPIRIMYRTPETVGMDRLADACGAWAMFPLEPSLVIDCGTCINYEFVNRAGEYLGGAISPGLRMRFRAMHEMTARLPLAEAAQEVLLIGNSTTTSLQSGVMNGALEEIEGIMRRYRENHPGIRVILTGGDAHFFEKHVKPPIFVAPELVLIGLNSILLHNVYP